LGKASLYPNVWWFLARQCRLHAVLTYGSETAPRTLEHVPQPPMAALDMRWHRRFVRGCTLSNSSQGQAPIMTLKWMSRWNCFCERLSFALLPCCKMRDENIQSSLRSWKTAPTALESRLAVKPKLRTYFKCLPSVGSCWICSGGYPIRVSKGRLCPCMEGLQHTRQQRSISLSSLQHVRTSDISSKTNLMLISPYSSSLLFSSLLFSFLYFSSHWCLR
jgi:hypothetical protein